MNIVKKNGFLFMVFAACICVSKLSHAVEQNTANYCNRMHYLPYIEFGGTRFNHGQARTAYGADLFIPFWQSYQHLVFSDLRFYNRTGTPFEGNVHLGYRHLSPNEDYMFGIYGAYDRKKSEIGNYFSQLTFGGEYWFKKLFLGANFYQPIGDSSKPVGMSQTADLDRIYKNVWITTNMQYEKAMQGGDLEVGYEILRGLTGYVGGYYFVATDTDNVSGPRARVTYDWYLKNGKRILKVFDKIGIEGGVQHDRPRGTLWYANVKLRLGLMLNKESRLEGVARHMVDLVHRDVDVVSSVSRPVQQDKKVYEIGGKPVYFERSDNGESLIDNSKYMVRKTGYNTGVIRSDEGKQLSVDLKPLSKNVPVVVVN